MFHVMSVHGFIASGPFLHAASLTCREILNDFDEKESEDYFMDCIKWHNIFFIILKMQHPLSRCRKIVSVSLNNHYK